jgi:hypothetical protein
MNEQAWLPMCNSVMPRFPQIMDPLQRVTVSLERYPVMGLL